MVAPLNIYIFRKGALIVIKIKEIKVYSKWNDWEPKCMCYKNNPLCNDRKDCEEIEVTINPYRNIDECKRSRSYKRANGAIRQVT